MLRKMQQAIGLIGLALLLSIVVSVAARRSLPKPTGSFSVGRTSRIWVDSSRPEVLTSNLNDFRNVPVTIWYPAQAGAGTQAPYFPGLDRVAQNLAASGEVTPVEVFGLRFIQSRERLDAPIASNTKTYPVIIFSPGNGTNIEFYAAIADELASYGYIVVGINHPYDVAAVALQDGSVAQFAPGPIEIQARQAWVAVRVAVRVADVLFALHELHALNAGDDRLFAGRLDLTRVAVMGHSLGGITAAEACRANPEFLACLNLDGLQRGGPFSTDNDPTPPNQPFMMITKEAQLPPNFIASFKAIPSGSYLVVIHDAKHDSFTDGPLLIPALLPVPNEADQILALTRSYTLAFFNQTLKQQPSTLLEKPLESRQASLEVYPPHRPH
jgi:predicted dienelactone hydrolase